MTAFLGTPIDIDQQIAEVENEIFIADGMFDNLVRAGKMNRSRADFRLQCKRAVLQTLRQVRDGRQAAA